MATKRAKPNLTKTSGGKSQAQPVDRISKLPDPVIHRILSFVPTIDVVRMSLLSKRWRRMWFSVPALNFSDANSTKYFPSRGTIDFYSFVNKCVKHRMAASYYISDSVVTRFQLDVEYPLGRSSLDKCLAFAVFSNAAEEIDLRAKMGLNYSLPGAVLNMRSLSVLKLDNLVFESSYSAISLPALKHLSLIVDKLRDELLRDLISGCPSLDNFFLHYTDHTWSGRISITSSTLKFLEIKTSFIKQVHVEARNLVSFKYDGHCKHLNISACTAIRNLSLITHLMDYQPLESLSFGLPVLENLTLGNFKLSKYNKIRGKNLKSIRLVNPRSFPMVDVVEVTIEAPNLTSFSYKGRNELRLLSNLPHDPSSCN